MNWKGCIVEESLADNRVLNNINIVKVRITDETNSAERWHIYNVIVNEEQITSLHKQLKDKWYMHFWNDHEFIVLFEDKKFKIEMNDARGRKEVIEYGASLGISKEQLDFQTEF